MRRIRVIPTLLLRGAGVVKTVRFSKPVYIGDPINTVKIFNEKEVDEIAVLDITATRERRPPNVARIAEIAGEAFMPLAYGGGITTVQEVEAILRAGAEKVVICSAALRVPGLVEEAARRYGSQAVVVAIDVKKALLRGPRVYLESGSVAAGDDPVRYAIRAEDAGAGEILLNSIDRDGTYQGYDLELIGSVAHAVDVPVIACGGARNIADLAQAVQAGASAVAAGSMFVFHGATRGILVNFPEQAALRQQLYSVA